MPFQFHLQESNKSKKEQENEDKKDKHKSFSEEDKKQKVHRKPETPRKPFMKVVVKEKQKS